MSDRSVLWALQALVVGLPLFLGGRDPLALTAAGAAVLVLLVVTLRARRARADVAPHAPGLVPLVLFVALALSTTVPLPPDLLATLSPTAAGLYRDTLAGWPQGGGWTIWRALSLDPWATWVETAKIGIAIGAYAVVAAYPWGDVGERTRVLGRLLLTLVIAGAALAAVAIVLDASGVEQVMLVTDEPAFPGRASGPFVNPNHLAAWLEMVIPLAAAFAIAQLAALRRRIVGAADTGHRLGVVAGRAWMTALISNQARLVAPLAALAAVVLMLVAHLATRSRGGLASLLVGLAVALGGLYGGAGRASRRARLVATALGVLLVVTGVGAMLLWAAADDDLVAESETVDASFQQRLAAFAIVPSVIAEYPVLGAGLGTFLHAFRPHQAPPVHASDWDHAHNDYLELMVESGVLGAALVLAFGIAVGAFLLRMRQRDDAEPQRSRTHDEFEVPGWWAALAERDAMAWGLVGGIAAILVHSLVDFSLRMPGNLLLVMVLLGCLVLATAPRLRSRGMALGALTGLLLLAAAPIVADRVVQLAGGMPLSPGAAIDRADLLVAEAGDEARDEALALVHQVIDRAPAFREAHEQLAAILHDDPAGETALRVALRIEPWCTPTRDELALRLWRRGERDAAAAEIEESVRREPHLEAHAFLSPALAPVEPGHDQMIRALAEGDTVAVRLATLEPMLVAAVERGLVRATDEVPSGPRRAEIVADRVTLLEAHERWSEAAALQRDEAMADPSDLTGLARAARNYLKANDGEKAEGALLEALLRTPERGDLYRWLAVDVYAARGDYASAEKVLAGGQRNAIDRMPVYDAVTRVISGRETAWAESLLTQELGADPSRAGTLGTPDVAEVGLGGLR